MSDITIEIDGFEREVEVTCETWEHPDPSVGIMCSSCEDYKVYHWEESRELTSEEYSKISLEDEDRIFDLLNEEGPPEESDHSWDE